MSNETIRVNPSSSGDSNQTSSAHEQGGVDLASALTALRQSNPLVQCITNTVVTNFTANVLLAAGASPAMVDNPQESGVFAGIASAVLINIGTPYSDTSEAMFAAATAAKTAATPWVLDPVAVGGLSWRTGICTDLLSLAHPAIIRGNASEIIGLAGAGGGGRGVDAADDTLTALPVAKQLAAQNHCAVAISGPADYITDGRRVVAINGGHEWLTRVTGVGCALGALMAAFAAAVPNHVDAAAAATALMCLAGERAAAESRASGSFAVALVDHLMLITPDELAAQTRLTQSQADAH